MKRERSHGEGRTIEVGLIVKESVVENLHGNLLLSKVLGLEFGVLDSDVFFDITAGKLNLLVLARAVGAHDGPIACGDGDAKENDKEEVGLDTAVAEDGEGTLDKPWDTEDECCEVSVGEVTITLCEADEGCVLYGGGVCDGDRVGGHGGVRGHGRLGDETGGDVSWHGRRPQSNTRRLEKQTFPAPNPPLALFVPILSQPRGPMSRDFHVLCAEGSSE